MKDALAPAGIITVQAMGIADELRLDLVGRNQRVWAPVGVTVAQPWHYERRWWRVMLVVPGRAGQLWWSWTLAMTAAALAPAVA